jgi:hypothetical protein
VVILKTKKKKLLRLKSKTNRNYINGANFERLVRKYFEEQNFTISRSAGSHGKFDLQGHDDSGVWDIQCKYGMNDAGANRLADELKDELLEKYPLLRLPVVVSVMYAVKDKKPVGVYRILVPQVEEINAQSKDDSVAGAKAN